MEEQKKEEVKKPEPVKVTVTAPQSGNAEVHLPHPDPAHPDLHVTVEAPATPKIGAVTPVTVVAGKSSFKKFLDVLFLGVIVVFCAAGVVHVLNIFFK